MARPFLKLRERLHDYEIDQVRLSRELLLSVRTVSLCMSAHRPWDLDAIYKIMEILEIPAGQMHKYFPKDGQNEAGCNRGSPSSRLAYFPALRVYRSRRVGREGRGTEWTPARPS